ncbi:c-type cytochrome biogenesis protein CcmI [Rhizobium leguminosarum bv. viciae]|nr:c-type cytochrome biogenesis protein CcmI [Rhizobium leguminosarum bv. viciae]
MVIWIVFAIITTVIIASLLHPLASGRVRFNDGAAAAGWVYRDQLFELDRELLANEIGCNEYEYARAETARRLFKASQQKQEEYRRLPHPHRWLRLAIAAFLPLASIGLYGFTGSPDMPSLPLQARLEDPGQDIAILVARTERHLEGKPDDGRGWDVIAPIYLRAGRIADARSAYRNALRLLGPDIHRLGGLAAALMAEAHGSVDKETLDVLRQIVQLEPENPRALFYIALGMEQTGRTAEALMAFEALAKLSPADAPWLLLVNQHIAVNGGVPLIAAGTVDRRQTIKVMVTGLDAKLSESPDDLNGWLRLVRSYAVLNERSLADGALKRGLAAFPPPGEQGRQLLALARELGIATEGATQ